MFIAAHEWSRPHPDNGSPAITSSVPPSQCQPDTEAAAFYSRLYEGRPDAALKQRAIHFLRAQIGQLSHTCELPPSSQDLESCMRNASQLATARYSAYLDCRKAGAPRRYFTNRAHALYFLRAVAPTKLVDGAWLYGLIRHRANPRFSGLVQTYLEELGEGVPGKNHVLLYRQLLARYGLDPVDDLDAGLYTQGLIQLALACNAEDFLPELIGFNLGYEQLPLHLLITAYELNELGLDPYYFTLHVTVDNMDTGHARRAVQAVLDNQPRLGNREDFWRRVRVGFQLSHAGIGTHKVIEGFDIEREVQRIFRRKSAAGHGAHSDFCRVAGRNVNDWLADPTDVPDFLLALQRAGWIKRGAPAAESRFWRLLQGERAEMFGVFTGYELQTIHDWLRGAGAADGQAYAEPGPAASGPRRTSFRVAARLASARGELLFPQPPDDELLDGDLQAFDHQLATQDETGQAMLLAEALSPSQHWTPAGLKATRMFCQRMR